MELPNETVVVPEMPNREFLERYAKPGCVGLVGGATLIDFAIRRAQRHIHPDGQWATWSHAFLFQGLRLDGHHWVIESDLELAHKHIRLGVRSKVRRRLGKT